MADQDARDPQFDAMTARLLRREALRHAAEGLNTTSGPGLEDALAQVSAEVTAEAAYRRANAGQSAAGVRISDAPVVAAANPVRRG
jgi:phage shock protein A